MCKTGVITAKLHSLFKDQGHSKKTVLLIVIIALTSVTVTTTSALIHGNLTVPSTGTIRTIGIEAYNSSSREQKISTIYWDKVWIGSTKNVTVYIRSISNYRVTLALSTENWVPTEISQYMTLSWDYNGTELDPGDIIPVTLTLTVKYSTALLNHLINNELGSFNVDIYIEAS